MKENIKKPLYREVVEVKVLHFILVTVSRRQAAAIHSNYFRVTDWSVPGS